MKKIILRIVIIIITILCSACNKKGNNAGTGKVSVTPGPSVTLPADGAQGNNTPGGKTEDTIQSTFTIKDYFPFQADTEYVYEGKGNEFASYRTYVDYLDDLNHRIQTRTDNGGTETVRVLELKDGRLTVVYLADECYYRENFLEKKAAEDEIEILLMEPVISGTQWTLPDGRKRYITGTNIEVLTPSGTYKAVEVTTDGVDGQTKDYYAAGTGLVKSVFQPGDLEVSSSLKGMNKNTPFTQVIDAYYPDMDEKIYTVRLTLQFHTGDITRLVLQEAVKKGLPGSSFSPLFTTHTTINSLYLGTDKIVYADFSRDLISEMNAGSGFEMLILKCITNTLGNYYGVSEVYITIDNKPYESGHIKMNKGETFKVDMKAVTK